MSEKVRIFFVHLYAILLFLIDYNAKYNAFKKNLYVLNLCQNREINK